ncbi:MAG: hypothetical protein OXI41_00925 [Chloroflexota bacterium]|nr:hypothetical protein [Chloroflexota bacterium]MDE2896191.1 hypothetical protein [Chloroflexota bacterium]
MPTPSIWRINQAFVVERFPNLVRFFVAPVKRQTRFEDGFAPRRLSDALLTLLFAGHR